MQLIFTQRQFTGLKPASPKKLMSILGFFLLAFLSFSNPVRAQNSPADCKTGCTSNDVQIKAAYLSDASGNQLPQNFVCPLSGTATVYLTLELTTKTPRIGVVIYANIKNFTPPSTIGSLVTNFSQCFGTNLNQPTNKVTFTAPFNWSCGTPIVLTDVFLGWGTGNTNFCTGNGFQCPATSSKCYSLPSGQYIPIVTPSANPASATLCSSIAGGTTAIFNLTNLESTVKGSQSNVTVSWFADQALTNAIATPSSYTSATGNVYAKVASNTDPSVFSTSTVMLTVNTTPAAPVLGKVDNCNGTSTITATGLVSGAALTWSDGGSGNPRTVSTTTALTVTQTVNGCTSAASNSVTPAPKTTPAAPTLGKVDNCNGTSTITATGLVGGATLAWSDGGSGNPRTVSTTTALTVTQAVNGCISAASNSITPAPKTAPAAPALGKVDNCNGTSTITATGLVSGATLAWSDGGSGNPRTVSTTTALTVTQTVNGCTSAASNSVTPAPKAAPSAPSVLYNAPACDANTFSITLSSVVSGGTYSILDKNGNTIPGVSPGNSYVAPDNNGFSFSNIPAGSGYQVTVESNGCSPAASSCGTAQITALRRQSSTAITTEKDATITESIVLSDPLTKVAAVPNPYNHKIKFSLQSAVSGQGSLELYDMLGRKIQTVFQGYVQKGLMQNIEYSVPNTQRTNLIYLFKVGNERKTGLLIGGK